MSAPNSTVAVATALAYRPSFEGVLAAAKGGDGRAFEQIYLRLNRRILAFALARGAHDAEGAVNDIFLRAFDRLHSFDGNEAQFNAWVFTIARNLLIDESRKAARRPQEVSAETHPKAEPITTADSVEQAAITHGALLECLCHLTPDQRDVVMLRIVADLTIDAIADILAKPPGAVKALQRRAFRTLSTILHQEGVPL